MADDESRLVKLMTAYQGGDLGAFEQLYASLADEVRRYFRRSHRDSGLVHDLVQDTFLELHRSRRTYAAPLPVRPWVYGIARHVSARSRRAPLQMHVDDVAQNQMSEIDSLDVENAIDALPLSVREPWLLHHAFGFSFASVAARETPVCVYCAGMATTPRSSSLTAERLRSWSGSVR
jgi:DNA-directed RNA polymerase specialized sigma24 family protein